MCAHCREHSLRAYYRVQNRHTARIIVKCELDFPAHEFPRNARRPSFVSLGIYIHSKLRHDNNSPSFVVGESISQPPARWPIHPLSAARAIPQPSQTIGPKQRVHGIVLLSNGYLFLVHNRVLIQILSLIPNGDAESIAEIARFGGVRKRGRFHVRCSLVSDTLLCWGNRCCRMNLSIGLEKQIAI